MPTFTHQSDMPGARQRLAEWHLQPAAFDRLAPPWQSIEVLSRPGAIENGATLTMRLSAGPFGIRWKALHRDVESGRQFVDEQVRGPFHRWVHTHTFESAGTHASRLIDHVDYQLPLPPLGEWFGGSTTRHMLRRMFAFRHRRTRLDLMRHDTYDDADPLEIAITGATGLIGTDLTAFLKTGGHHVHRISRSTPSRETDIQWSPSDGVLNADQLEGLDAVIHLAGENLAGGRWTDERKQRILESRENGTELLVDRLTSLDDPPDVLVSASAVGYYGATGDKTVDETSDSGDTFLAEVCRRWESASEPARDAGIRVVNPRLGVVLSAKGGALAEMLTPFKFGLGGPIGSGDQWMPWVSLDDVVGALHMLLFEDDIQGPVNVVAPNPVPNRDFVDTLGDVINRPTFLPLPTFAVRMLFGEMGEETLLQGQRVEPTILQQQNFEFAFPQLDSALRHTLGRPADDA